MPHYFSKEQDSRLNLKQIMIRLRDDSFSLFSGSGVFSKKKIDTGTKLLIESAVVKENWKVLDLGCGIGVVGISLLRRHDRIKAVMADVNKRAVMLAQKNIELHGFGKRCTAVESDGFENISGKFNAIMLNPPQTAGRKICYRLIEESFMHLEKKGLLEMVARHKKGGKVLSEKMEEIFGNVRTEKISSGFRVYISEKK